MKNLFSLVCLVVLLGVSASVMGQDATQYPGEVHKFSVTDHSAGGFVYSWGVYTDADLTSAVATGFNLTAGTTNAATFEWTTIPTNGTTGIVYYVAVKESNATTGCSTSRYTTVKIVGSTYDLAITPVDVDGVLVTDLDDCMVGSGQILSNSASLVTTGTNVRYFKVLLTNDGTTPWTQGTWKFDYVLTGKDGQATPVETISSVEVVGSPAGVTGVTATAAATATTVSVANLGTFIIKVTTADNPGTATTFDVTVPFTGSNLKVGAGEITETDAASNTATYTLRTYPTTSVITIDAP